MIDWWNGLSLALQVFYGIGLLSALMSVLQLGLSLLGWGGDALDLDLEVGDADSAGASLISGQTLSAFFLGFGWVGAAVITAGLGLLIAIITASVVGVIVMFAVYFMIRQVLRLQAKGNLDYHNAIGEEAMVYVTLPGNDEDGGGQIQFMIQGRLRTASARKVTPGAVKPGEKVRITGMFGETSFVVESLRETPPAPTLSSS
ncbi:hypothetical protein [Actomonas aquatica]|uniref:NfeD-like C-terminal domain-containing protein n=1 Tax=Actomonas aquatica TaxID=2866162 RepID=A0ABZ1C5R7_9BACT|nr:hypothetical protein [Opitutus sp. WL0086]WRQ87071.1 hypothetical protein K1X11_019830 [Opitutus sp. WL0086]